MASSAMCSEVISKVVIVMLLFDDTPFPNKTN